MTNEATLNIQITGNSVEQVQAMVLALADKLGGDNISDVKLATDKAEAKMAVKTKAKRKTKAEKEAEAAAAAEAEAEAPAKEEPAGVVKDLTPAEAKEAGIKEVQEHFAENPGCLDEITAIQKKYGVKMFTEITDAKALDFLADVRLLTAGAPSA